MIGGAASDHPTILPDPLNCCHSEQSEESLIFSRTVVIINIRMGLISTDLCISMIQRTEEIGCKNSLFNHGGWYGDREQDMIKIIYESDYQGPIGIIGHTLHEDVRVFIQRNKNGLYRVLDSLKLSHQ